MPSGQETDWAYTLTTVPGTHMGQVPMCIFNILLSTLHYNDRNSQDLS